MSQTSAFDGFRPDAIQFMADLAEHNERAWFQPRKADFEELIREPFERLVEALAVRFDARGLPLLADPRRSIFRIHRDTRFSKDKSPYKTHQAARFTWTGDESPFAERSHGAGGYFHFEPGSMYVGGGMFMPERAMLDAWRRRVADAPEEVHAAIEEPAFAAMFGQVTSHEPFKRMPPGYPADHPDAELLRMRDVVFGRPLSDEEVLSSTLPDTLAEAFAAAMPVFRLLASLRPADD
ncbi:MAG: DUF2461 domain-containing protein [Chloroflexi bacterium]|nr:DUF2461 domain-containing protein [Chloroflexota bacterium]